MKGLIKMESFIKPQEYDYNELRRAIEALTDEYTFLQSGVLGRSCAGRNIPYLKIGRKKEYVLFAAGVHGSEHITTTDLSFAFVSRNIIFSGRITELGKFI